MSWSCLSVYLVPCGPVEFAKILQPVFPRYAGKLRARAAVTDLDQLTGSSQRVLNNFRLLVTNGNEALARVSQRFAHADPRPTHVNQQLFELLRHTFDSVDVLHNSGARAAQKDRADRLLAFPWPSEAPADDAAAPGAIRIDVDGCFDGPWERKYAVGTIFLRG